MDNRDPITGALVQGSPQGYRVTIPRRPLWQRVGIKLGIYDPTKAAAKKWGKAVSEEYRKASTFGRHVK